MSATAKDVFILAQANPYFNVYGILCASCDAPWPLNFHDGIATSGLSIQRLLEHCCPYCGCPIFYRPSGPTETKRQGGIPSPTNWLSRIKEWILG